MPGNAAKIVFPGSVFSVPEPGNTVYITFDDGPDEIITPRVLKLLAEKNVKATFFCLGEKVEANPLLYQNILSGGHKTGLHGYSHLNGYRTRTNVYVENVLRAGELMSTNLFRPPYGRIRVSQFRQIKQKHKVVFWSLMSYDFLKNNTVENCFKYLVKNTSPGDIVVFHDSQKVPLDLASLLSQYIDHCREKNYFFGVLD